MKGTNFGLVIAWLENIKHVKRKGHWPDWIEFGAGYLKDRQCVLCLKGGRRAGYFRRMAFAPAIRPLGL